MSNRKAILIVGFNNWGKTNLIYSLFNRWQFSRNTSHQIPFINNSPGFMAFSSSNDDMTSENYIANVDERLNNSGNSTDFFGVLCPNIHPDNHFINILTNPPFSVFKEIHLLLIEYKYDNMAKLVINNIKEQVTNSNLTDRIILHTISEIDAVDFQSYTSPNKMNQMVSLLNTIYP